MYTVAKTMANRLFSRTEEVCNTAGGDIHPPHAAKVEAISACVSSAPSYVISGAAADVS